MLGSESPKNLRSESQKNTFAPPVHAGGPPPNVTGNSSSPSTGQKLDEVAKEPLKSAMKGQQKSTQKTARNVHFALRAEGHDALQMQEESMNAVIKMALQHSPRTASLQRQPTHGALPSVASSSSSSSSSSSVSGKKITWFVESRTASAVNALISVLNEKKPKEKDIVKALKTLAVCIRGMEAKEQKKAGGGEFVESNRLLQARQAYRQGTLALSPAERSKENVDKDAGIPKGKVATQTNGDIFDNDDDDEEPIDLEEREILDKAYCNDIQKGLEDPVFKEIHAMRDMDLSHYESTDVLMRDLNAFTPMIVKAQKEIETSKEALKAIDKENYGYDNLPDEVAMAVEKTGEQLNAMSAEINDVILKFKAKLNELIKK